MFDTVQLHHQRPSGREGKGNQINSHGFDNIEVETTREGEAANFVCVLQLRPLSMRVTKKRMKKKIVR